MAVNYEIVDIKNATGNADDYGVMERGNPDTCMTLLGWDEIGLYDNQFSNPVYVRIIAN